MRETIKPYFPLILTVLCAVCAISIFFYGFSGSNHGIFSDIGATFTNITQIDNLTSIAEEINAQSSKPIPALRYMSRALTVGDAIVFDELFDVAHLDGTTTSIKAISHAALYLVDVQSSDGNSVLTTLSSEEINALEEIPSAVVYDEKEHLLYFHQSGIYNFRIRLYYDYRPSVLFECQIPVEVR